MENIKSVFVTGVTGNQGSAVTKHLLDNGYDVIGLTRKANSEKAQYWKNQGVTIVEGNLNNPSSYQKELNTSDAIYFVQPVQNKTTEIKEGKQFIDSVVVNSKSHLVYASVLGADLNTGIPHFDSKFEIEKHIKASNINYTILRPASFYENYLVPQVIKGIKKGSYMSPLDKTCKQQMIGCDDIGNIATQVISNPQKYSSKTLSIATEENEIGNLPQMFSDAIKKPVKYKKLPSFIVRIVLGKNLHKMFKYMNQNNFCVIDNIQNVRDEFNIKGGFKNWVNQNFSPKRL